MIDGDRDGGAEPEGQDEAGDGYRARRACVAAEHARVYLHAHDEHEENEAEVRGEVQHGHGRGREDGRGEAGDAAHDGRAEDDAANDFCDDPRLADAPQEERE